MRMDVRTEAGKIRKQIVDSCDICGGSGFIQNSNSETEDCICTIVFEFVIELLYSRIPRMYWLQTLDSLEGIEDLYRRYVKLFVNQIHSAMDNGLGMLFMGPNGIGKTSLQTYIGREAIIAGYNVRYFTLERYIMANREGDSDFLNDVQGADVLLIDEIDKAYSKKGNDFTVKRTDELFRKAIVEGKVLIVCTNFDETMIMEEFGESVHSMLQRRLRFILMEGEDYSGEIQDQWSELLESRFDYMNENLVYQAKRYVGVV